VEAAACMVAPGAWLVVIGMSPLVSVGVASVSR
jgi:hypothetical protein